MDNSILLVIYKIDEIRYAIPLHLVKMVIRVVEITPIPQSSEHIMGVINYYGEILPVVNLRKIIKLPEREISLSDQILIVRTESRTIGLLVDEVLTVEKFLIEDIIKPERVLKKDEYFENSLQGCIRLVNGLILIHSIDTFISNKDENIIRDFIDSVEVQ